MGLFDWFTKEGRLKNHVARMSNLDTHADDRDASLKWLVREGSAQALLGLLSRFDLNLSQRVKDQSEKDQVFEALREIGEPVVKPLRAWIRQCKQPLIPLRLLIELQGENSAIELVFEVLENERVKNQFQPEKKLQLLVWLSERRHAGMVAAAAPHLTDFDENVRYAAVEALAFQEDDAVAAPLLAVITNPKEDSNRLRFRIADLFATRSWPVSDPAVASALPEGYAVADGRVVRR
jgi:hypothetical protein